MNTLYKALMSGTGVGALTGRFDADTVLPWLEEAATTSMLQLSRPINNHEVSYRWAIRALAACFSEMGSTELALRISSVLNNDQLTIPDVKEILEGSDRDLPLKKIQQIGKLLSEGEGYTAIARNLKVERRTISKIDKVIGITQARDDRLITYATQLAQEDNLSIRTFASKYNLTISKARNIIKNSQKITQELK